METFFKLGPRLQAIAACVPSHAKLGDIGTDHAYLPLFLYKQGQIIKAIAVDVNEGPYQSACTAVNKAGLEGKIDVRLGNGLQPIDPGEVDTLTLAGMGGKTMLDILIAKPEVLNEVTMLILQPQGAEASVRHTLMHMGWLLEKEFLVEEEGRIYVVMILSRSKGKNAQELAEQEALWMSQIQIRLSNSLKRPVNSELIKTIYWRFGPLIWITPNDLLVRLLDSYKQELSKASQEMLKATKPEVQKQREKILDEIDVLTILMQAVEESTKEIKINQC